jgi:hypothetical protein
MAKTPDEDLDRRHNHNEDLKIPSKEGRAPRPATEPDHAEGSSKSPGSTIDPATGETPSPETRSH